VPGLGDGERGADRLQVPHLADEDDVGVLPERVLEGLGEGLGVGPHLPLVHRAVLVPVDELDRVLDGDDVAFRSRLILSSMAARVVDFPDPWDRSPAPAPGAARPASSHGGRPSSSREMDLVGDLAQGHGDAPPLLVAVAPEPGEVLDAEGEVQLVVRLEPLLLLFGQDRVGQGEGVLGGEDMLTGSSPGPRRPGAGPLPHREVEVRGPPLDHLLEEGPDAQSAPRLPWTAPLRPPGSESAEFGRPRECVQVTAVSFTTSSRVVMPRSTFFSPSVRRVSIPSETAWSLSSSVRPPA
jgi:hypothetical protein